MFESLPPIYSLFLASLTHLKQVQEYQDVLIYIGGRRQVLMAKGNMTG